MKIEPIKPLMIKIPTGYKQNTENPSCLIVTKSEKCQNGWDFGEEKNLIGKINKIIDYINDKSDQLL